jgi:hypothetical protein
MVEQDPGRLRAVVKRVLVAMVAGLDVAGLVPEMVRAADTTDLVQKKMVCEGGRMYFDSQQCQRGKQQVFGIATGQQKYGLDETF